MNHFSGLTAIDRTETAADEVSTQRLLTSDSLWLSKKHSHRLWSISVVRALSFSCKMTVFNGCLPDPLDKLSNVAGVEGSKALGNVDELAQ